MESNNLDVQKTGEAFQRWLRPAHSPAHARRTAVRNAAFLLPHLTPGMRLLDVGCGPGSITIGLAEAIAPALLFEILFEVSLRIKSVRFTLSPFVFFIRS